MKYIVNFTKQADKDGTRYVGVCAVNFKTMGEVYISATSMSETKNEKEILDIKAKELAHQLNQSLLSDLIKDLRVIKDLAVVFTAETQSKTAQTIAEKLNQILIDLTEVDVIWKLPDDDERPQEYNLREHDWRE